MFSTLIKIPILKRLIPSILIRLLKIFNLNRGYFKIRGNYWYLDFLDGVDRQIILNQTYENNEIIKLTSLMKKKKIDSFIDVGANSGFYTFYISQMFKNLKIYSFEPNREAFYKLKKTYTKNVQFKKKISIFNYGLSNKSLKMKMSSPIKFGYPQTGGTAVVDHVNKKNFSQNSFFKIGDHVIKEKKKNIAIKIDVEGHELNVLKGIKKLLQENNCILQIEIWSQNFYKINYFIRSLKYKLIKQISENYFYIKEK